MGIRIRTRRARGPQDEELFTRDEEGRRALQKNLGIHRRLGRTVTPDDCGTRYTVTDETGEFIQESLVIRTE
jgi:hypothetical protein